MSIDDIARLIQAYLAQDYPGWLGIRLTIDIQLGDEKDQIRHRLPSVRPIPAAPPAPAIPAACPSGSLADDIERILREVGHRLTTREIVRELGRRGLGRAESTIKVILSEMVDDGKIDNQQEGNPRGYGLLN
jgi:hypothetical protein